MAMGTAMDLLVVRRLETERLWATDSMEPTVTWITLLSHCQLFDSRRILPIFGLCERRKREIGKS